MERRKGYVYIPNLQASAKSARTAYRAGTKLVFMGEKRIGGGISSLCFFLWKIFAKI
jgi:hypothetical protein